MTKKQLYAFLTQNLLKNKNSLEKLPDIMA